MVYFFVFLLRMNVVLNNLKWTNCGSGTKVILCNRRGLTRRQYDTTCLGSLIWVWCGWCHCCLPLCILWSVSCAWCCCLMMFLSILLWTHVCEGFVCRLYSRSCTQSLQFVRLCVLVRRAIVVPMPIVHCWPITVAALSCCICIGDCCICTMCDGSINWHDAHTNPGAHWYILVYHSCTIAIECFPT